MNEPRTPSTCSLTSPCLPPLPRLGDIIPRTDWYGGGEGRGEGVEPGPAPLTSNPSPPLSKSLQTTIYKRAEESGATRALHLCSRRICLVMLAILVLIVSESPAAQDAKPQSKQPSPAEIGPRPDPVKAPEPAAIEAAIRRGVEFLATNQNKDGSWGSAHLKGGIEIYTPVPGGHHAFQSAVTALSISALIETGGDSETVKKAIERGEDWLMENLPKVRRGSPDALYNIWSHAYGIQALVRMHKRVADKDRRQKIEKLIVEQIGYLKRYESVDKGWGYYDFRSESQRPGTDSTSFMTAAVLVALREAKDIGVDVPEKLVKGAVDSIHRQRLPDFSYLYGEYMKWMPQHPINRPGGSLGRTQACNLALRMWGDEKVTDKITKTWLDRLFARNGWLSLARKTTIPHESFFAVAGYFFYFGHYYSGMLIEQLPAADRPFYQDHLATIMIRLQEKDGSWFDYPLYNYHQQYGTAFALMTLKRCQHAEEKGKQP